MPGFDGTGPSGQGKFTGGGRGYCVGYLRPRFGRGRFNSGQGFGRGLGRQGLNPGYSGEDNQDLNQDTELEDLKQQAAFISQNIVEINQRIRELEGK